MKRLYSYTKNKGGVGIVLFFMTIWLTCLVDWIMNFQNLWQYGPITNKIGDIGLEWVISFIGIFIPPLGVFTGFWW